MLQAELHRIVERLKKYYHPEKVILFGSLASGKIHEWSDIDLVVVKRTAKKGIERFLEVSDICANRVATHFLVYTPEEFEQLTSDHTSFLANEVIREGKILYP